MLKLFIGILILYIVNILVAICISKAMMTKTGDEFDTIFTNALIFSLILCCFELLLNSFMWKLDIKTTCEKLAFFV